MPAACPTLTLKNDLAEIPRLAEFVEVFCASFHPAREDLLALQLALEETVTNVVNHGYKDGGAHTLTVRLAVHEHRITATVTDDAPAFDPLARPEVDIHLPLEQRPIGGLGVHLVKKLMDRVHYEHRNGQNRLTLERVLRPRPLPDSATCPTLHRPVPWKSPKPS
jgi:anti-sigma regulatory factor (Ser/Thr protein kinase)